MRFLPLLITLLFLSCNTSIKKEHLKSVNSKNIDSINNFTSVKHWATTISSSTENAIKELYKNDAILVLDSDSIVISSDAIGTYYNKQKLQIHSTASIYQIEAHKEKGIDYEINEYALNNKSKINQLTIYQSDERTQKRVFEFNTSKDSSTEIDLTEIDTQRKKWMELCNNHTIEKLVNELYTENTLYYSHKPLVIGRENLIQKYSYMTKDTYSLELNPLSIIPVNSTTVFEIGQCKGSYNGKYILIWKKETDGNWRIFIDSNV